MLTDLLAANATYAAAFQAGGLPRRPARRLSVVTCMDARIDTLAVLGLETGDAHVLRNAGGRVSEDVIRSLLVSTRILGVTAVVVMHHTDCGMAEITRHSVHEVLDDVDARDLDAMDLLTIDDREEALRADVARVQRSPFLPDDLDVIGVTYDVTSGLVHPLPGRPS